MTIITEVQVKLKKSDETSDNDFTKTTDICPIFIPYLPHIYPILFATGVVACLSSVCQANGKGGV